MRVVFYARPWSVDILTAVENHWRRSAPVESIFITHQLEAARALTALDREVIHIPTDIAALVVPGPVTELQRIERRYGDALLPLPRYLMAERYFEGRDRSWQLDQLVRHALFFEQLFDEFSPEMIVGEAVDIMPAWLAYDMAPAHGCEPVGVIPSTLPPGRVLMLRGHDEVAGAAETYDAFRRGGLTGEQEAAARDLQGIVLGEGTRLDYLPPPRQRLDLMRRFANGEVLRNHLSRSIWRLREKRADNWFMQPDPVVHRLTQPLRALRGAVANRRYLNDPPGSLPFVFYPLHFQPEATTLIHGSYFEDQLTVVRNLARSLPAGWELVVKEHFWMSGQRALGFYRALKSIPNLRLLPFSVPTNELILTAEIVAVISGTAGLEGALVGKPVLIFGHYPWDYAPTIRRAGAMADLPRQIQELSEAELTPDHPDVLAFAASWDASLPPGRYFKTRAYDWCEPENVVRLADAIESRLHSGAQRPHLAEASPA
jgi:hypothetical protein